MKKHYFNTSLVSKKNQYFSLDATFQLYLGSQTM